MLTHKNQVRFTSVERQQLSSLTGEDPGDIKTIEELINYIHTHRQTIDQRYCGTTACFARRLLTSFLPAECA